MIMFHFCRYVCPELNINFHFSVFFYNSTDKLIISDVDGTITKSDIKVTIGQQIKKKKNITRIAKLP